MRKQILEETEKLQGFGSRDIGNLTASEWIALPGRCVALEKLGGAYSQGPIQAAVPKLIQASIPLGT